MDVALQILSIFFLATGSFFVLIGGIGLIRLPDFFTRLHAAGITDTAGVALIMIGLLCEAGWTPPAIKLLMIVLLVFIVSPTASHALAKAALYDDLEPWRTSDDNEDFRPEVTDK